MKLCIIGTGYVGLVSGTCLSDLGNSVYCIDKDKDKLAILSQGKSPFFEPELSALLSRNIEAGRLKFSDTLADAFDETEVFFIAVGTPSDENGEADTSAVFAVAQEIIDLLKTQKTTSKKILVTKSTVPVGTGRRIMSMLDDVGLSESVSVVSNPEFLREGSAIYDFFHPDRIVVGSDSSHALDRMEHLYSSLYRSEAPVVKTTLESSELSKYASNAFLATKISFINEVSNMCELLGADVKDVAKIMGMDGRIGKYFLHPGPGYGGSCFPKDTQALIHLAKHVGYDLKIVQSVEHVNDFQKTKVIKELSTYFNGDLKGKKVGLLGLAFKPRTDDVRDAPALKIVEALVSHGVTISAFDPEASDNFKLLCKYDVSYESNLYDVALDADALILVTEWNAFRKLDLHKLASLMKKPVFFDLRNVYDSDVLRDAGFEYYVIGRDCSFKGKL